MQKRYLQKSLFLISQLNDDLANKAYKYYGKYYGSGSGDQTIKFPVDAGVFLVTVTSYGADTGGFYVVSVGTTQIKILTVATAPNTTLSASGRTLTYNVPAYNEITFLWLASY